LSLTFLLLYVATNRVATPLKALDGSDESPLLSRSATPKSPLEG
jgi:hypothetical protein